MPKNRLAPLPFWPGWLPARIFSGIFLVIFLLVEDENKSADVRYEVERALLAGELCCVSVKLIEIKTCRRK